MSRAILVTGATGTQGGALIDALVAGDDDFLILAVTRDASSAAAQRVASKSASKIRLVQGDLDDVPALFAAARAAAAGVPVWGVFSVQVAMGPGYTPDGEVAQGKALVDEALRAGSGVGHFVYTSVDRGGDDASWDEPSPMPQFATKYHIERHLRAAAAGSGMGWTVLRPTSFMENLLPGFGAVAFYAMLRDNMPASKTLHWVAAADIGHFAAEAFRKPAEYSGRALGLAGDELTFAQLDEVFTRVTGKPFNILGLRQEVFPGMEVVIKWMAEHGYDVDVARVREMHPGLISMEEWLRKSPFVDA
ncbi:hypothetical protein RB595_004976 [Gaeumannomyces hyphopodioides]